jgi:Tat protein secretion system quality control protein TatD with DNase activity
MLQTKSGRTTANIVPADRILTETDAPFTKTPDVAYAMKMLADIKGIPVKELDSLIPQNAKSLLS